MFVTARKLRKCVRAKIASKDGQRIAARQVMQETGNNGTASHAGAGCEAADTEQAGKRPQADDEACAIGEQHLLATEADSEVAA
ncbi:hypothetical protein PYH37_000451 [Sinorhizobium numidicum]|uniref:Uncharacterized protein n=1 Tax=Sinorhizobium numidicum TaxID=680248 RepID=A0ABY8CWJ0_9HYPH|nr:hypothetical protein [Sinorhizobium numidicum]WEX75109.1 hypothetical protein PYH37_000451 [Sinorhizobium numidicum]WEX81103.1 hypothetical protein PYH38_000453 [Sinorhizobium numidicum]